MARNRQMWKLVCVLQYALAMCVGALAQDRNNETARDSIDRQLAPLPVEMLYSIPWVGRVALSPDGEWVAYQACSSKNKSVVADPRFVDFSKTGAPAIYQGCELRMINLRNREDILLSGGANGWFAHWSLDGQLLAFCTDRDGVVNLWIWNRTSKQARKVSDVIIRSATAEPQWTPDGKAIVALALPEGTNVEQAANMTVGGSPLVSKTETESKTSVILYRSETKANAKSDSVTNKGVEGYDTSRFWGDLVIIDIDKGTHKVFAKGTKSWGFRVSPDGRFIAFTKQQGFLAWGSFAVLHDLYLYSLETEETRVLSTGLAFDGRSFSWAPDSSRIAYFTEEMEQGNCYIVPRNGGQPVLVTPGKHPSFSTIERAPLWDSRGENIYLVSLSDSWAPNSRPAEENGVWRVKLASNSLEKVGAVPQRKVTDIGIPYYKGNLTTVGQTSSILVLTLDEQTKRAGVYKIDIATGQSAKILEGDCAIGETGYQRLQLDISRNASAMVYSSEDSGHPSELWVITTDSKHPVQLTNSRFGIAQYLLGKPQIIEWRGHDGKQAQGIILLPADYRKGQRYPAIIYQYPGRVQADAVHRFGEVRLSYPVENMQLFATRGYVVFLPNLPPVTFGRPMHSLVEAIEPALNALVDTGVADPDRIGVMGHSYGGYAVLSYLVQSKRFKAAVARAGIYDLASAYGYLPRNGTMFGALWAEGIQSGLGGTPWQYRDRYIENSPYFYLDQVDTPLLLIHGTADTATPTYGDDEVFVGLRRLGKEVEYAKYEGEGHAEIAWGYANQIDYINRVIAWFDKYLKPAQPPK